MPTNRFTGVPRPETYQESCAANWPRPTCRACGNPCAYDREFRAARLCQSCYDTESLYTVTKGDLLCKKRL